MPERFLVTGATGTVGPTVVTGLADRATVRVASRRPGTARERFADGPEYVEFDLERPETWGPALAGVDGVFLMFPPAVGVKRVRAFVDAAARVGVDRVAYLSVRGAQRVPVLPHRRIERHLATADPAHTFLRADYFVQNLGGVHRPEIVDRDEIYVPAGEGALGFVDARDVGAAAVTALTEAGHAASAYTLTGPESLSFGQVADVFSDVLDREITYADPSPVAFARHMSRRGVPRGLVAFMLAEYTVARFGVLSGTTRDLRRVLGRDPTPIRQYVADHRETFAPE